MEKVPSLDWSWQTGFIQIVNIEKTENSSVKLISESHFLDLYTEALRHYTLGIQYESSLQTSFVSGALRTLRSLGHKERMHQFMLR